MAEPARPATRGVCKPTCRNKPRSRKGLILQSLLILCFLSLLVGVVTMFGRAGLACWAIAALSFFVVPASSLAQAVAVPPAGPPNAFAPSPGLSTRIVLVEWRIKKGREQEFLDYWSTRATVADRSGLVGEFLSRVEDRTQFPWMVWNLDPRWTTYVNVGIWRSGADFQEQIGRFIDNSRPPLAFEAQRRRRVLVAPERWRTGATPLPFFSHPDVR